MLSQQQWQPLAKLQTSKTHKKKSFKAWLSVFSEHIKKYWEFSQHLNACEKNGPECQSSKTLGNYFQRNPHNWLMHKQGWISEIWQMQSKILQNYISIRTNAFHAITCMPMFAANTLPPCESRLASALSSDRVTGDRQGTVLITLTFLAGASWSLWVSRVARRTSRHCKYKTRFGQLRRIVYYDEHLARL